MIYRSAPSFWQQYAREFRRPIDPPPRRPHPSAWPDAGLHAAWLGHSTVLVKIDGFTFLTDPVFSSRAGIHLGVTTLGVKRLVEPALGVGELPRIDMVLLSHAHMDHFDLPSLRYLEDRKVPVVTARHTSDLLRVPNWQQVTELAWGEETSVGPAVIRGVEVNHWGARVRTDTFRGYNGYLIKAGRWHVFFAGDTADTHKLDGIAGAKGVDLGIMPVGAYNPWIRFHCNPEQAWRMSQEVRADHVLPVHHKTFQLSREPLEEPMERLYRAAGPNDSRIVLSEVGQEFHL